MVAVVVQSNVRYKIRGCRSSRSVAVVVGRFKRRYPSEDLGKERRCRIEVEEQEQD